MMMMISSYNCPEIGRLMAAPEQLIPAIITKIKWVKYGT